MPWLVISLACACASTETRGADIDGPADDGSLGGGQLGDGDGDGEGDAPSRDPGGPGDPSGGCVPNPSDATCPELCPETCNLRDDDCDGRVDEDADNPLCVLPSAESICAQGRCLITECMAGFRDCDGTLDNGCEADLASPEHCGGCGMVCQFDNTMGACVDGTCEPAGCVSPYLDCQADDGLCETFGATLQNCGECGRGCDNPGRAIPTCEDGACTIDDCLGNFGDCNRDIADGCELELKTVANCGGCGVGCAFAGSGTSCASGTCLVETCAPGFADCDGSVLTPCNALDSDAHCGGCDRPCTVGALPQVVSARCMDRACVTQCAAGFGDCDGEPGCERPLASVNNCGGCGAVCDPPHAVGSCGTGTCAVGTCDQGWADCDGQPGNGCETDTGRPDNCGRCGNTCAAMIGCDGATCTGISCPEGQADCDAVDMCNYDLSDDGTCGSCNVRCGFDEDVDGHGSVGCAVIDPAPGQMAWACEVTCANGYADCDGDYRNGCEVSLTDTNNCGGCGNVCTKLHATPTCDSGICEVDVCSADWADCDGDDLSCETLLSTGENCGACGNACTLPNAVGVCSGSPGSRSCIIGSCTPVEFENCDGNIATGCEADTTGDSLNCNGCGNDCAGAANVQSATCMDSSCAFTCASGYADCNAASGCETSLSLNTSCGSCDTDCTTLPRVQGTSCSGGANPLCQVQSCQPGYGNCDGSAGNGCEVDTRNSGAHCGACSGQPGNTPCTGLPNVDTSNCSGGACTIGACSGNYEDCNRVVADGCEWDPAVDGMCCDPNQDDDGDGSDNCADQCPSDPGKVVPGVCGCFVSDADSDGDGAKDCVEDCDSDPAKTAPGVCGCNMPDVDSDGDGSLDCVDPCPLDAGLGSCPLKQLDINPSFVDAALSSFPVLVRITGDAGLQGARDDGLDLFFSSNGGPSNLDFEIEHFDRAAGDLIAWVRIPSVSSNATTRFYLRYADGTANDRQNAAAVWSSSYRAVYHLDYGGGAGTQADSTSYAHHLAADEAGREPTHRASAQIGAGLTFDGANDRLLQIAADTTGSNLDITGQLTLSGWFYALGPNPKDHAWYIVTKRGEVAGTDTHFAALLNKNFRALDYYHGDAPNPGAAGVTGDDGAAFSLDRWVHFSITINQSTNDARWYTDGQQRATAQDATGGVDWITKVNNFPLAVGGGLAAADIGFRGHLDEVRVSATVRSAAWVRAEYENQKSSSTFLSVSNP